MALQPKQEQPGDAIYTVNSGIFRLFYKNFSKAGKRKIRKTTSTKELK